MEQKTYVYTGEELEFWRPEGKHCQSPTGTCVLLGDPEYACCSVFGNLETEK